MKKKKYAGAKRALVLFYQLLFIFPGEIGGPIVCQRCKSCDWFVAGIMTFGDSCSHSSRSSLAAFSSIERYESWIERNSGININKNSTCPSNKPGTCCYLIMKKKPKIVF